MAETDRSVTRVFVKTQAKSNKKFKRDARKSVNPSNQNKAERNTQSHGDLVWADAPFYVAKAKGGVVAI